MITRRAFLAGGLATLAAPRAWARPINRAPRFSSTPFTLGIASGEPLADSVVIWTRLAPDPLRGSGMPQGTIEVPWQIASDEQMSRVVQSGTALAAPELGHSVHVEVSHLNPARWYWYRFRAGDELSAIGRTRTLPAATGGVDRLRFGFASCQNYETGYFTAYDHLAAEDLDLVFHLGDYIYEDAGREGRARRHQGGESLSLADYRNRYAQYKSDPSLQAAHAAFPWIVTWDDHEVANNYAGDISEHEDPVDLFLARRAAAYQAYYEHMPLRRSAQAHGPSLQLYRRFSCGSLAAFHVLDTRQHRTVQPCGNYVASPCDAMHDPSATMLGSAQERWLFQGIEDSRARWNVIPQQVMMAKVDLTPGIGERYSMDQWSGYDVPRTRLLSFLAGQRTKNPIVLTGDIHSHWVNDLKVDFRDPGSPTVATEFVGTSISSGGDGDDLPAAMASIVSENPFVRFYSGQRGYVSCEVTPNEMHAHYRTVEYVSRPGAPVATRASFVVEAGRPGVLRDRT